MLILCAQIISTLSYSIMNIDGMRIKLHEHNNKSKWKDINIELKTNGAEMNIFWFREVKLVEVLERFSFRHGRMWLWFEHLDIDSSTWVLELAILLYSNFVHGIPW